VGSTNLNITSWMNNWELDVVIEDEAFCRSMEEMYRQDLEGSTEIVLEQRRRVRPTGDKPMPPRRRGAGGRARRAAASALRIGNAVRTAMQARKVIGPAEQRLMVNAGLGLGVLAAIAFVWPRIVAWPLGAFCAWVALALMLRARRTV
jgi:cardiolipin synthase